MVRAQDGGGYGAANPIRRAGPSEAARRGAVAYLLRSLGTDTHRLPHTGALNYQDGAPQIPAAALSNPDADQLERLAALGPVRVKLVLTPKTLEGAQSWNVVGEVKGRERPDEIVLIGAHLDSWDLGTGATDDGAGVAIVTTVGKMIAALPQPPRRTLRVVLFGAEEMDWSGPAYAKAHAGEAAHIVLAAEADFGARRVISVQLPPAVADGAFARALGDAIAPLGAFIDRRRRSLAATTCGRWRSSACPPRRCARTGSTISTPTTPRTTRSTRSIRPSSRRPRPCGRPSSISPPTATSTSARRRANIRTSV